MREYLKSALAVGLVLSLGACTKRQIGSEKKQEVYQYTAEVACLSFVMDRLREGLHPGTQAEHPITLSKEGDRRFRETYRQTLNHISEAKSPEEREKRERQQVATLLTTLRAESPDLMKKCDRLAAGFRTCQKHHGNQFKLKECLEQENRDSMEEIVGFLNRESLSAIRKPSRPKAR